MLSKLASFINWRPISTVGMIGSIHSIGVGLGYVFMLPEFTRSLLFAEITTLMNPALFFTILIVVGLVSLWALFTDSERWISRTNTIQAVVWLFITFVYIFGGFFLLGITAGLLWSIIPGYVSYVYKDRHNIAAHNAGW